MSKKILIVEDEKTLRMALNFKLQEEGFETIEAADGEEGLQKALSEKPDLILLDVVMPKMDGFAVLEELEKDEVGRNLDIIILTNLSPSGEVLKHRENGKYEYLVKSDWKIEELAEKIKNKLNNSARK